MTRTITQTMTNLIDNEYFFCIDYPKNDLKNNSDYSALYVQGWIASRRSIEKISFNNDYHTDLKIHSRPDVEKLYPNYSITGFRYLFYPKEIIKIPDKLEIQFIIANNTYRILINQDIIKNAKERAPIIMEKKQAKLQKIKPYLICPVCRGDLKDFKEEFFCVNCGVSFPQTDTSYNFLTLELRKLFSIIETDNISSNAYGGVIDQLITELEDGLILDCGAGNRHVQFNNIINYEIVDYPSTDVLGVGEKLPFKDNTFDAILSLAVLEHVMDPFKCASEIMRVLKTGGKLLCQVPFLQPYHGYPHHYYNMTEQGLINLFKGLSVESCKVPLNGHPIFTLSWFLNIWCNGLKNYDLEYFKNLKIKDILDPGENYLNEPYVKNLDQKCQRDIASVNFLIAIKP